MRHAKSSQPPSTPSGSLSSADILLQKLHSRTDLSKIRSISGAAHAASVLWTPSAAAQLANLSPHHTLHSQLGTTATFALLQTPSPNDASTAPHAQAIEATLGGPDAMASRAGTAAHAALAAAQLMKIREGAPEAWVRTGRITLASAAIATLFLGRWAPIGAAEAAGSGMWNIAHGVWDASTLEVVGGGPDAARRLIDMLGPVEADGGRSIGIISRYFVERYNFDKGMFCVVFRCGVCVFVSHVQLRYHRSSLHVRPPCYVPVSSPYIVRRSFGFRNNRSSAVWCTFRPCTSRYRTSPITVIWSRAPPCTRSSRATEVYRGPFESVSDDLSSNLSAIFVHCHKLYQFPLKTSELSEPRFSASTSSLLAHRRCLTTLK